MSRIDQASQRRAAWQAAPGAIKHTGHFVPVECAATYHEDGSECCSKLSLSPHPNRTSRPALPPSRPHAGSAWARLHRKRNPSSQAACLVLYLLRRGLEGRPRRNRGHRRHGRRPPGGHRGRGHPTTRGCRGRHLRRGSRLLAQPLAALGRGSTARSRGCAGGTGGRGRGRHGTTPSQGSCRRGAAAHRLLEALEGAKAAPALAPRGGGRHRGTASRRRWRQLATAGRWGGRQRTTPSWGRGQLAPTPTGWGRQLAPTGSRWGRQGTPCGGGGWRQRCAPGCGGRRQGSAPARPTRGRPGDRRRPRPEASPEPLYPLVDARAREPLQVRDPAVSCSLRVRTQADGVLPAADLERVPHEPLVAERFHRGAL